MNEAAATGEDLKRALEALRNGVPNRDAVRLLGCGQTPVIDRFQEQLREANEAFDEGRQARGTLIAGGFGSGKSHLLQYLKYVALRENFLCSHIVVSKETPLYDPAKVYSAAAEAAVAPGIMGNAIQEVALRLDLRSRSYTDFFVWANADENEVAPVFQATLLLHERLNADPEMMEKIRGFWAGERLAIADIRAGMRQIRQTATYQLRSVPARDLPLQRFRFASRLVRAAGFAGWVLLIDEVELIGRYSRLQRARSYAELARWLGHVESDQYPALTAVAAITDDFALNVLREKGDVEYVGPQLRSRDNDESRSLAGRAETGMRVIERALKLDPPDDVELQRTHSTLRRIHGEAYDWDPPETPSSVMAVSRPMRSHVRRWINQWDLQRLYPGNILATVETELRIGYTESPALEQLAGESDSDPGVGS